MIPEHFRTKSSQGKEKVFEIFCLGEGERGEKERGQATESNVYATCKCFSDH